MSCVNCGDEEKTMVEMPCRVCTLLDNDESVKLVHWCKDCTAYICDPCRSDMIRRARAFVANKVEQVAEVVKSVLPSAKKKKENFPTDEFSEADQTKT